MYIWYDKKVPMETPAVWSRHATFPDTRHQLFLAFELHRISCRRRQYQIADGRLRYFIDMLLPHSLNLVDATECLFDPHPSTTSSPAVYFRELDSGRTK